MDLLSLRKKLPASRKQEVFDRFLFNEGTKEDGSDDQDDTAAQTAGQLGIGDEAHTMGSTQYSKVAGTAAVCHAKTSGDGRVDGIEANELTDDCGTDDGADNNQEGDDDVAEVDGINQLVQVRIGTNADHDDENEAGAHEGLQTFSCCFCCVRDNPRHGCNGNDDDHSSKGMNGNTEDFRQDGFTHETAGCIEANAHEEGTAHFLDGRNGIVLFRFDIKAGTDQGVAVAGELRMFMTDLVQDSRRQDGEDVRNGQDRNGEGVVVGCLVARYGLIDLGKRYSTGTVAAAHDGKDIVQKDHIRGNAKDEAAGNSEHGRADEAAKDGRQIPSEGFQQEFLFQTKNGTTDQEDNEEAQEVSLIHDHANGFGIFGGNHLICKQISRNEEGQNETAADIGIPEGDAFTDFVADNTEGQHEGKTTSKISA